MFKEQEQAKQLEQAKPEQMGRSSRPEIKGTEETWLATRRKCTPAKWEEPAVLLANRIWRIKCRAIHKWERVTLKWEGSLRKWEGEIALRPRDNKKARKSQTNTELKSIKAEGRIPS